MTPSMKLAAIAGLMTSTVAMAEPSRHIVTIPMAGAPSAGSLSTPSPTGTPALAASRIIYLNKSGVAVKLGTTDSRIDQSSLPPADTTIPPWNASPTLWSDTVACVRDMFARFEVQVVEADPGDVPHMEAVFGGSSRLFEMPNWLSVAGLASDCSVIENSMVFVFTETIPQNQLNAQFACEVVSQALGHAYGLDREVLATDTMSIVPTTGPRAFQDQTSACGDSQPRPCGTNGSGCRPDQNSFALLIDRIGNSDVTPPVVAITSPGDGEVVPPGFNVVVTATDNLKVRSVTLMIDDIDLGPRTSPPYEFTAPLALADGQHLVKAIASDGKSQSDHVAHVTVRSDATTSHDGGCAATSGGRFALMIIVAGLLRKRRPR
jgi:hypothetical protein